MTAKRLSWLSSTRSMRAMSLFLRRLRSPPTSGYPSLATEQALDGPEQHLGLNRLRQILVTPGGQDPLAVPLHGLRGERDDGDGRPARQHADRAGGLQPRH